MASKSVIKPVGRLFPNLNQRIASYDPATQITIFEQMSLERFKQVTANIGNPEFERDASVIAHEYRHCADHLGTLWGQKHLLKLQKALGTVLAGKNVSPRLILDYKVEENQSFQNEFYVPFPSNNTPEMPSESWLLTMSIYELSDKKYFTNKGKYAMLVEFLNPKQELIARIPLSVAALLEVNAVVEEIIFKMLNIYQNYKEDAAVYLKIFVDEFRGYALNYKYALYHVASQITGSLLHQPTWPAGYIVASTIATLALNLPSSLIKTLPVGENPMIGKSANLAQTLLDNEDYGFVFYLLCKNFGETEQSHNLSPEFILRSECLDAILKANNLPPKEELQTLVEKEFNAIATQMEEGRFKNRFLNYNKVGLSILNSGGLGGVGKHVFDKFGRSGWNPAYAMIDGGVDYQASWLRRMRTEEDNIKNANFWYSTVKQLDDIMQKTYQSKRAR